MQWYRTLFMTRTFAIYLLTFFMISKILTSVLSLLITVTTALPYAPTPLVALTVPVSADSLVMELTAQV